MARRVVGRNPASKEWANAPVDPPSPSATGRGLKRLRAAPGAEELRRQVVREQGEAQAAERAAPHHNVPGVLPFKVGCRVRDRRVSDRTLRLGRVLHTHVYLQTMAGQQYGHVVHWGGDNVELVPAHDMTVLA